MASLALWKGIFTHDFNIEYVASYTSRNLPEVLPHLGVLGGAEGVAALLGGGAVWIFGALAQGADLDALPSPMLPYVAGDCQLRDDLLRRR